MTGEFVYGDDVYIPEEYMDEEWEFIRGIPGYMVSDHGRVWSGKRQKFLKPKHLDNHGHLGFGFRVDGKSIYLYLARILAEAFIPNPNNLPIVRHLNDRPYDNDLSNLAWGTQKDNHHDSVENGTYRPFRDEDREKSYEKSRKPIKAINLKTGEEFIFEGQNRASRELNIQQSNIWKVLNGERNSTCGYYFRYLKEEKYD